MPDSSAPPQQSLTTAAGDAPTEVARGSLLKNTLYLTLSQVITIPLAVVSNALVGRYLGPEEFGFMYLASTLCAFAVLLLEWGQQGALPALVARNRSQASTYLGTSLAWRALMSVLIAGGLGVICVLLGYDNAARWAVALTFPVSILNSVAAGYKDTLRGLERTDIPSYAHVAQQLLLLAVAVPVLVLGGKLDALLTSYAAVGVITVAYLHRALRRLGVSALKYARETLGQLFFLGTPFAFFGLAMVLTPQINAMFLSKLVPPEVIGWFAVSQRLIGLLLFPASALIGALYPTLCRLFTDDHDEFVRTSRESLHGVSLIAVPAAVGCALFPEIGVSIFGSAEFAGAADHLRLMSVFVFLVYFSMPLGTCILAANRHKSWTLVQCVSVGGALIGNPLLVPWFQQRWGNGALGTCLSLVVCEAIMVACGVALAPRALFDRTFIKSILLMLLAGAAMVAVAQVTKPLSLFLAVPASLLIYCLVVWVSGAIHPSTMATIRGFVQRKLLRRG